MRTMTAREVKTISERSFGRSPGGGKNIVILRGGPAAVVLPIAKAERTKPVEIRPFQDAWGDIERTLRAFKPEFETWQEAIK